MHTTNLASLFSVYTHHETERATTGEKNSSEGQGLLSTARNLLGSLACRFLAGCARPCTLPSAFHFVGHVSHQYSVHP